MREPVARIALGSRQDGNYKYMSGVFLPLGQNGTTTPPITTGLVGLYQPQSYRPGPTTAGPGGAVWIDISGNNNHAQVYGSPTVDSVSNVFGATGSFTCLTGTVNDQIIWPASILPANYTLFFVARYNTSNSTTAATLKNSNDGSSTTGFGTAFGNAISSTGGEIRVSYSASNGDKIWMGVQNFLSSGSPIANKRYLITGEARVTNDLGDGINTLENEWDGGSNYSWVYNPTTGAAVQKAGLSRQFFTSIFDTSNSFVLGNTWVRGRYSSGSVFSGLTYAYFRNYYLYELAQNNLHKIFTGYDRSWFAGFFAGYAGSAYQGNVLTVANTHSNNWVLGTSSNASDSGVQLFRTNKVQRYNSTPSNAGATYAQLSVNPIPAEGSNFQIAEVIVYNRGLSSSEITSVENYLGTKYGI